MGVREPFNVIHLTAEDGLGDTINSRLIEASADLKKYWSMMRATKIH
jgi:hypothetical protein